MNARMCRVSHLMIIISSTGETEEFVNMLSCHFYLSDFFPHRVYPLKTVLQMKVPNGQDACELHAVKGDRCVTKAGRLLTNGRCHGNTATSQGHDLLVGGLPRWQQDVKDWEQIYFVQL